MKIKMEDIKKIGELDWATFKHKFEVNGLNKGKLTQEQYVDLCELYTALKSGDTTPKEYFNNVVEGTWIPTVEGVEKII